MEVRVKYNQSIVDIAIQETGTTSSVIAICEFNNIALTQLLEVGAIIRIPNSIAKETEIYNYYKRKLLNPSTGQTIQDGAILFENGLFENGLFQ